MEKKEENPKQENPLLDAGEEVKIGDLILVSSCIRVDALAGIAKQLLKDKNVREVLTNGKLNIRGTAYG